MKYKIEKEKILVSLENGEEVMDSIYKIVDKEDILFGWINGIGAMENITLGSYNSQKKGYIKRNLSGEFELTSLIGNISTKEGNPFVHIHVNLSDEECNAYGGHLFSGTITATCEMIIMISQNKLLRKMNDHIGLHLWDLNCEK